jgi:stalled ribosome rescue protein Dom34
MTHAVVWIDHKEARIFHVHPEAADESTILSPQHHLHRHPKGRGEPPEHPDDAKHFFGRVAHELDGLDRVLIVGPASAKFEFFKFVHANHRQLESKIVGIETADHPTGGEIVARARAISKRATEWAVPMLGVD